MKTRILHAFVFVLVFMFGAASLCGAKEVLMPFVATTKTQKGDDRIGVIKYLYLSFEYQEHGKSAGLIVASPNDIGVISSGTQAAIYEAIDRAARAACLSSDSWIVTIRFLEPDRTVYGNSISAMIALSILALARGDMIRENRIITGTVTKDGRIGSVGDIPLKVDAAGREHIWLFIPEEPDPADDTWELPFLGYVSYVADVEDAYKKLTDHSLRTWKGGAR